MDRIILQVHSIDNDNITISLEIYLPYSIKVNDNPVIINYKNLNYFIESFNADKSARLTNSEDYEQRIEYVDSIMSLRTNYRTLELRDDSAKAFTDLLKRVYLDWTQSLNCEQDGNKKLRSKYEVRL